MDAASRRALDAHLQPLDLEALAGGRNPFQAADDPEIDRIVGFAGEVLREMRLDDAQLGAAVEQQFAAGRSRRQAQLVARGFLVVVDLADQFLEDVLEREDAEQSTELVDDDDQLILVRPQRLEQAVDRLVRRHEYRVAADLVQRLVQIALREFAQDIGQGDDTRDLFRVVGVERDAVVRLGGDRSEGFADRPVAVE